MVISIRDFAEATGISKFTVYTWTRRVYLPPGVSFAGVDKSLKIAKNYELYEKIKAFKHGI